MLQEFLNKEFIPITEDTNFDKLKKASAEVVKKINKDKEKIARYTLVGLDPEIPANNSDLEEVKLIIIGHWNTFATNSKDTSVTFIRAVILEALQTIAKEDDLANLIWFSGRNAIKYYNVGNEKDLLVKFLLDIGNRIENEVSESWSFPIEEEIDVPELTAATISKTDLEAHLKAAAIQSSVGGENPAWASQNDANWSTFFAARASKGISELLNKALKNQATEIRNNQADFIFQNTLLQMRTQLLWWKEAGFSISLKSGYKDLQNGVLQIVLAKDYSSFVPEMYPLSVDYFLKETHNSLVKSQEKKIKISEILKLVESNSENLKTILEEYAGEERRTSFLNFIRSIVYGKYKINQIKEIVGITDSIELTYAEFTVWLFHDFHSLKISDSN